MMTTNTAPQPAKTNTVDENGWCKNSTDFVGQCPRCQKMIPTGHPVLSSMDGDQLLSCMRCENKPAKPNDMTAEEWAEQWDMCRHSSDRSRLAAIFQQAMDAATREADQRVAELEDEVVQLNLLVDTFIEASWNNMSEEDRSKCRADGVTSWVDLRAVFHGLPAAQPKGGA